MVRGGRVDAVGRAVAERSALPAFNASAANASRHRIGLRPVGIVRHNSIAAEASARADGGFPRAARAALARRLGRESKALDARSRRGRARVRRRPHNAVNGLGRARIF